jgi:hypothetical protein
VRSYTVYEKVDVVAAGTAVLADAHSRVASRADGIHEQALLRIRRGESEIHAVEAHQRRLLKGTIKSVPARR